jgi:hypothetical protein
MLRHGRPDRVLAFTDDLASSADTADMVRRAEAAGLSVQIVGHQAGYRAGQEPREEVTPTADPAPPAHEQLPF